MAYFKVYCIIAGVLCPKVTIVMMSTAIPLVLDDG